MHLALCPFNPTVGDLDGNRLGAFALARDSAERQADLIVLPELALTGYPPRDLLEQEGFCEDVSASAHRLAEAFADVAPTATLIVGSPWKPPGDQATPDAFDSAARPRNSALVLRAGSIIARYDKQLLPTYDVFDEHRYFAPGATPIVIEVAGRRVGLAICEDLWQADDIPAAPAAARYVHRPDPVQQLAAAGAELIVIPTASPFALGKHRRQRDIMLRHVARTGLPMASVNQLGGNDDLIFDGRARIVFPPGSSDQAPQRRSNTAFTGESLLVDLSATQASFNGRAASAEPGPDPERADDDDLAMLWAALVLGVRDYARKSGFARICLGVSGGIDSALTAAIAAAAIGPDNVLGCAMPSRFSSDHSVEDARELARRLDLTLIHAPIAASHEAAEASLENAFDEACRWAECDNSPGITEENIQSRLRGLFMMAVSNKTGALLVTTGNKSELAVGYATLYGDMNGGLAVLADVTKVRVFQLARWVNTHHRRAGFERPPIPERSITKPPSAELRDGQIDADSLPPYEILDEIVERYVEARQSPARIARETGFEPALVDRIVRLTDLNEYKRKQLAIGLKVTPIAFGRGRRRPIVNRYRPTASPERIETR